MILSGRKTQPCRAICQYRTNQNNANKQYLTLPNFHGY
ncbi:hypothetical protein C7S13_4752 [Burkholderia cepacia]|nr:hypothetical protein [Burkholderia cepacia]